MTTAERLYVSWYRSPQDGRQHAVTDDEATRAMNDGGEPESICGQRIAPTSIATPPGHDCQTCLRYLRARQTMSGLDVDEQPSVIRRLTSAIFRTSVRP